MGTQRQIILSNSPGFIDPEWSEPVTDNGQLLTGNRFIDPEWSGEVLFKTLPSNSNSGSILTGTSFRLFL